MISSVTFSLLSIQCGYPGSAHDTLQWQVKLVHCNLEGPDETAPAQHSVFAGKRLDHSLGSVANDALQKISQF